ncbi:radixin [Neltuma alba]|uniref:radixin n=1 Tax=Neltuma alba TaxID=207710 RepID=UPI0010A4C292|nr:radixin-like [Prosopis alba]
MDGGRRKRRLDGEEEDSEEQKMEKFFALIRSTKEVRDRLSKERDSNKKLEEDKFKNIWNPTFQPEDFVPDYQDSGTRTTHPAGPSNEKEVDIVQDKESEPIAEAAPPPPPPPPPPPVHDEKANEEDKLDLDLNLSL